MLLSRKIIGIMLLIFSAAMIYAAVGTGIGIIEIQVTNEPPKILNVTFWQGNTLINQTSISVADSSGNLNTFTLKVEVEDNNTLTDIKYIRVVFKTQECSSPDPRCYLNFTYDISANSIIRSPDHTQFTVSVVNTPNSALTRGTYEFQLTFPKVAMNLGTYGWSINVSVEDNSTNSDYKELLNLFDFAYYAEFELTPKLTIPNARPGTNVTGLTWVNITAINRNSTIKIYTNHTYMLDSSGNNVTNWILENTVTLTIDTVSGSLSTTPVSYNITGPSETGNYGVNWQISVPSGVSSGTYYFYYYVTIEGR